MGRHDTGGTPPDPGTELDQISHRDDRPTPPRAAPRAAPSRAGDRGPLPWSMVAMLVLGACGGREADDILPGGIPARTDLHAATQLPPDSVRTVARRDWGWRLIYHPARAPAPAEQRAASALCGLERRGVRQIVHLPRLDATADPGARMLDIHCA